MICPSENQPNLSKFDSNYNLMKQNKWIFLYFQYMYRMLSLIMDLTKALSL